MFDTSKLRQDIPAQFSILLGMYPEILSSTIEKVQKENHDFFTGASNEISARAIGKIARFAKEKGFLSS